MDTATRLSPARTASRAIVQESYDGRVDDRLTAEFSPKFLGLAIVSIVPALFWMSVLYFAAPFFGVSFTGPTLAAIGVVIACILGLSFCALALSRQN